MELEKNEKLVAAQAISQKGVVVYGTGNVGKAKEIPLSGEKLLAHVGKRARKGRVLEARIKAAGLRSQG
jgi:DNA topoisomerase IV subunit A (EC 5.99.1.3)